MKTRNINKADLLLELIVKELRDKYRCHTVILYGSRATGEETPESDYDVVGFSKYGKKLRIARKEKGKYLDLFIYGEKHFMPSENLHMSRGTILCEKNNFGSRLLRRIKGLAKKPVKRAPADEIEITKVWAFKMIERAKRRDIEGDFRRTWLTMSLLTDYFVLRKKPYRGSKESFRYLAKNDRVTYRLYQRVLKKPTDLKLLAQLVKRVTGRSKPNG